MDLQKYDLLTEIKVISSSYYACVTKKLTINANKPCCVKLNTNTVCKSLFCNFFRYSAEVCNDLNSVVKITVVSRM